MAVLEDLSEEECALVAILLDESGIDLAEFMWVDERNDDNLFRCYDYQFSWYRDKNKLQIDQAGRAVGKSLGIQLRSVAFPFSYPGEEMLLTAPELIHLNPVTKYVEEKILSTRLTRDMIDTRRGQRGIVKRPFEARFVNGSKIIGRIPQKDGRGVKGCVVGGTLVLTRRGQVPIEDVVVGDEVFTHKHRWRKVLHTYQYDNPVAVEVAGGGHRGLVMSESHDMWARRHKNPQRKLRLHEPGWVGFAHNDEPERYYLGSPAYFPEEPMPEFPTPKEEELAWVMGRWVADGIRMWQTKPSGTQTSARIHITVKDSEVDEVVRRCEDAGLTPYVRPHHNEMVSNVEVCDTDLVRFLDEHFGHRADGKQIPTWLLQGKRNVRRAWLEGYLSGDGHRDEKRKRWTAGSASKALAVSLRLLAQSLGLQASFSWVDPKVSEIRGVELKSEPQRSWRTTIFDEGNPTGLLDDGMVWRKVSKVTPATVGAVYDIAVEEDHSYVADGLVSHNQHPKKLEMDEAQDYPDAGWIEIMETLKFDDEEATFRAHGVTRGVRDYFYKLTQPNSGWRTHRLTGMHRPDWTAAERHDKEEFYGGRNAPDYRRNILGLHGDATNPLFVLSRLMQVVDENESSVYNTTEYYQARITDERLTDSGLPIGALVDPPNAHMRFERFWIGADIGMTSHPTEILVFAEDVEKRAKNNPKGQDVNMRLRLVSRIHMERISSANQRAVFTRLFEIYRPQAIAMDKTGLGLPIYQEIVEGEDRQLAKAIRGYNFSEKVTIGYEEGDENEYGEVEYEPIEALVLEASSDKLRALVDAGQIMLPWDIELLKEFQGESYAVKRSSTNPYGRKVFSSSRSLHTLDAARMAILAYALEHIEKRDQVEAFEPVMDIFIGA